MSLTVTPSFTPVAPIPGETFVKLRVRFESSGNVQDQFFTPAQLVALAQPDPDNAGKYLLPVTFATVPVGPYTVKVQAINATNAPYGPIGSGSGVVGLADGVWIPSPGAVA